MVAVHLTRENRADLIRVATDGDNGGYGRVEEFRKVFRTVRRGVETDLLEDLKGHRMDVTSWLGAGAGDIDQTVAGPAEDRFGEMAAARITRAEDENEGFAHG